MKTNVNLSEHSKVVYKSGFLWTQRSYNWGITVLPLQMNNACNLCTTYTLIWTPPPPQIKLELSVHYIIQLIQKHHSVILVKFPLPPKPIRIWKKRKKEQNNNNNKLQQKEQTKQQPRLELYHGLHQQLTLLIRLTYLIRLHDTWVSRIHRQCVNYELSKWVDVVIGDHESS